MDKPSLASRLARHDLLAGLDEATLQAITRQMRERALSPGEMLYARGDPGDRLYFILDGRLRISVLSAEGRELSVRIAGPDEMIGEISVFDGGERTADVFALGATRVTSLTGDAYFALMAENPALARNAMRFLCRRLRDTTYQLESIALYPIETRLARLLLFSLGATETPATGRRPAVDMNYSQSELAMLLGATRSKVNIALGNLEAAGAIRRTSDRVFCDREKLTLVAHAREN